jgi:hypothetical protein
MNTPSQDLHEVLTHLVDHGTIELGTDQSAKLIGAAARAREIEDAAREIDLLCDANGVPPTIALTAMDSAWGRDWAAAIKVLRGIGAEPPKPDGRTAHEVSLALVADFSSEGDCAWTVQQAALVSIAEAIYAERAKVRRMFTALDAAACALRVFSQVHGSTVAEVVLRTMVEPAFAQAKAEGR